MFDIFLFSYYRLSFSCPLDRSSPKLVPLCWVIVSHERYDDRWAFVKHVDTKPYWIFALSSCSSYSIILVEIASRSDLISVSMMVHIISEFAKADTDSNFVVTPVNHLGPRSRQSLWNWMSCGVRSCLSWKQEKQTLTAPIKTIIVRCVTTQRILCMLFCT